MIETRYVVRRRLDGRYWTGAYGAWTDDVQHAERFEFQFIALVAVEERSGESALEVDFASVPVEEGALVCR